MNSDQASLAATKDPGLMVGSAEEFAPQVAVEAAIRGRWSLYAVVALAGAGLMILQIVGARLLEPAFGSSVYVWGSVIALFMFALAMGYWLGGKLADRRPEYRTLGWTIVAGGVLFLAVPPLARSELTWRLSALGPFGALVAALVLFGPPAFLLGMVSPLGVKLVAVTAKRLGGTTGSLYAWSTFGAVGGTLLATFGLVPRYGKGSIVLGTAAGLILAALAGAALVHDPLSVRRKRRGLAAGACLVVCLGLLAFSSLVETVVGKVLLAASLLPLVFFAFLGVGWLWRALPASGTVASDAAGPAVASPPVVPRRLTVYSFYLVVLISGGSLMGLEIAGARMLEPFYGSSVYVWGSIITLFMIALGLGYFAGGKLADAFPNFVLLTTIIALGGIIASATPWMARWWDDQELKLGFLWGPLLAAVFLFFLPCLALGVVSPFAVRLRAAGLSGVGGVAGSLYAWSTAGSVLGALLVTFVLVPSFKKENVVHYLGVFLTGSAVVGMLCFEYGRQGRLSRQARVTATLMLLLLLGTQIVWVLAPAGPKPDPGYVLREHLDSPYHEIVVADSAYYTPQMQGFCTVEREKGDQEADRNLFRRKYRTGDQIEPVDVVRNLMFNEHVESALFVGRPDYQNAVAYTDLLHLGLIFFSGGAAPKRVFFIGGGGGIAPTQFRDHYPGCESEVAEIDAAVLAVARKWFRLREDARLRLFVGDGRRLLRAQAAGRYDMIILDAYSSAGRIPAHLLTWEFFQEVAARLTPEGVVVSNIISGLTGPKGRILRACLATLTGDPDGDGPRGPLFPQVYVFPKFYRQYYRPLDPYRDHHNVIVVATRQPKRLEKDELQRIAQHLVAEKSPVVKIHPFEYQYHVGNMWEKSLVANALEKEPGVVLTDDYCPVDTMMVPGG